MTALTLRLLGGGLLTLAGALFGWEKNAALRRSQRALELLCSALGRMEGELIGLKTPLPRLFARLADCPFFALLSAGFGGEALETLWRRAAQAQPIPPRDRLALAELGGVMGRFDAARQAAEIALVRQRLAESAAALEREIAGRGRRFAGLGAAFGTMLAVLLF